MRHAALTLVALTLALPAGAWAQHPVPLEPEPAAEEAPPKARSKTDKRTAELAERYGFEAKEVSGLRDQGLGWGEVEHALGIARKAGKPLDEVMALRERGMGWGKIARSYGFKLGEVKRAKAAGEELRDAPRERKTPKERGMKGAPERPRETPGTRPGKGPSREERGPKRR